MLGLLNSCCRLLQTSLGLENKAQASTSGSQMTRHRNAKQQICRSRTSHPHYSLLQPREFSICKDSNLGLLSKSVPLFLANHFPGETHVKTIVSAFGYDLAPGVEQLS